MDLSGKEIYKSEPKKLPVLPDTTRDVTATWDDTPVGIYRVETSAIVLGKTTSYVQYVLVAPLYVVVLSVIGACLLLVVVIIVVRKRLKKGRRR